MQASEISLWFDGACEPVNPGGVATGGWIVKDQSGNVLLQGHRMICRGDSATNNIAEYGALIGGLRAIQEQLPNVRIAKLNIFGDSQLVVNQFLGKWKCNKSHLQMLRSEADELAVAIAGANFDAKWIPREQNEEADALSRKAYTQATGKTFPVRVRS